MSITRALVRRNSRARVHSRSIEIRQLFELEDFGPSEAVERFREMEVGTKK